MRLSTRNPLFCHELETGHAVRRHHRSGEEKEAIVRIDFESEGDVLSADVAGGIEMPLATFYNGR